MLVGRWGILRSAIPQNISLTRTIALVHALAKLHNFCIAKQDEKHSKEPVNISEMHEIDEEVGMIHDVSYMDGHIVTIKSYLNTESQI